MTRKARESFLKSLRLQANKNYIIGVGYHAVDRGVPPARHASQLAGVAGAAKSKAGYPTPQSYGN
jgi:hypothetical protein